MMSPARRDLNISSLDENETDQISILKDISSKFNIISNDLTKFYSTIAEITLKLESLRFDSRTVDIIQNSTANIQQQSIQTTQQLNQEFIYQTEIQSQPMISDTFTLPRAENCNEIAEFWIYGKNGIKALKLWTQEEIKALDSSDKVRLWKWSRIGKAFDAFVGSYKEKCLQFYNFYTYPL